MRPQPRLLVLFLHQGDAAVPIAAVSSTFDVAAWLAVPARQEALRCLDARVTLGTLPYWTEKHNPGRTEHVE